MLDIEEAEKLYAAYRLSEAIPVFQKAAGEGNSRAMYFLYRYENNSSQNSLSGEMTGGDWLKKGAEAGDPLCGILFLASSMAKASPLQEKEAEWVKALEEAAPSDVFSATELAFYYIRKNLDKEDRKSTAEKEKAFRLLRRAADKGFMEAASALGARFVMDENPKKHKEGFPYMKQAAEAGVPMAIGNLANCYYYGKGTKKDRRLAKRYYEKAASLGLESSAMQLGAICYEEGEKERAFEIFKGSAERGWPDSMGWLAVCYYMGFGTEENRFLSKMWLEKAKAAGSTDAAAALEKYF